MDFLNISTFLTYFLNKILNRFLRIKNNETTWKKKQNIYKIMQEAKYL